MRTGDLSAACPTSSATRRTRSTRRSRRLAEPVHRAGRPRRDALSRPARSTPPTMTAAAPLLARAADLAAQRHADRGDGRALAAGRAINGYDSHLFEPIAQLVYRGSSTTVPGITNDNAQSFVFDDTNLFSYNRFSGTDRQETGLRANIGGRYHGQFRRWQLARADRRAVASTSPAPMRWASPIRPDRRQHRAGQTASYIVLGAQGSPLRRSRRWAPSCSSIPARLRVTRAGAGGTLQPYGTLLGRARLYLHRRRPGDRHASPTSTRSTVRVGVPLRSTTGTSTAALSWDLAQPTVARGDRRRAPMTTAISLAGGVRPA